MAGTKAEEADWRSALSPLALRRSASGGSFELPSVALRVERMRDRERVGWVTSHWKWSCNCAALRSRSVTERVRGRT